MTHLPAIYSRKAQLKIQQMAFVLVAIVIFFSLVALVYFSIAGASLTKNAQIQRESEAKQLARKMTGAPELIFNPDSETDCSSCVDLEKAFVMNPELYKDFWNIDYLSIERIYPEQPDQPCTPANYPDCNELVLVEENNYGAAETAYVTIARWDENEGRGYYAYELGRIHLSIEDP